MTTYEEELYDWLEENSYHPDIENVNEAKEFISAALDCLYGDKSLEHLDFLLENACSYLNIPFPKGEIKVKKVATTVPSSKDFFNLGVYLSKKQANKLNGE